MDRSAYVSALNQAQMVTLGVSALAVIIGLLLAYLISQPSPSRLTMLSMR